MEEPLDEVAGRPGAGVRDQVVATDAELRALRRYQGSDRAYELINRFLRRELEPGSFDEDELLIVDETVTALDSLMRQWRTPEPLRVYRGLRRRDVDALDPGASPSRSSISTTIDRDVAMRESQCRLTPRDPHSWRSTYQPWSPPSGCHLWVTLRSRTKAS